MHQFLATELCRESCTVKAAIFDFDGTISTLRCGWEAVMEKIMLEHLNGGKMAGEELLSHIRQYIAESTGIQTIYQMEWLAEQVELLCGRKPLDPWDYKDLYNEALLQMVDSRIAELESGKAEAEKYLVAGSREYLQLLMESGIAIYIASGTDEEDVRHEADLLGISQLVREVRGAPHRRKDCSKEAVIRDILQDGSLSGHELMVVGDGKVEIQLGQEAGALTVGIASQELRPERGMNPRKAEKLQRAGARYLAEDFQPLIAQWKGEFDHE
ncbi:MAG: HAD family hydrolase [Candidatus Merdivicinus sp.]|jgi:phosphoglycolate phosphatase-like HAD superfamily hydrolase